MLLDPPTPAAKPVPNDQPALPTDPAQIATMIATLRAKSIDGTITMEERRLAVALLRQGRVSAIAATSAKAKKAASAAAPALDLDSMM